MHAVSKALLLSCSASPKIIVKKEKMSKKSKSKERAL